MRCPALPLPDLLRILQSRCRRMDILPESPVGSMFPSGRCCRPPRRQLL